MSYFLTMHYHLEHQNGADDVVKSAVVSEDWMKDKLSIVPSGACGRIFIPCSYGALEDSGIDYWWVAIDEHGKIRVSDIEKICSIFNNEEVMEQILRRHNQIKASQSIKI